MVRRYCILRYKKQIQGSIYNVVPIWLMTMYKIDRDPHHTSLNISFLKTPLRFIFKIGIFFLSFFYFFILIFLYNWIIVELLKWCVFVRPKTNLTNHLSWTKEVNLLFWSVCYLLNRFIQFCLISRTVNLFIILYSYNDEPVVRLIYFSFIFRFTCVTVIYKLTQVRLLLPNTKYFPAYVFKFG